MRFKKYVVNRSQKLFTLTEQNRTFILQGSMIVHGIRKHFMIILIISMQFAEMRYTFFFLFCYVNKTQFAFLYSQMY